VILIFTTKFFQSTPIEALFFQMQALFLALILLFLLFYTVHLSLKRGKPNKVVLYYMALIAFMPLYSAIRANMEFGQPYLYGILGQRAWLILGVGIWFYYMLINRKIEMKTVESSFLFLVWASLIIFSFVVLIFDPSQLTGEESYVHVVEDIGAKFKFMSFFITFGAIYYFIKSTVYKQPKDFVILFLFLLYVVLVIKGRTYMLFLAMTFLVYWYMNFKLSRVVFLLGKGLLLLLLTLFVVQIIAPGFLDVMLGKFGDMFMVLTGQESDDVSANARIWTSLTVLDYFTSSPLSIWLGTGKVSNQWNDGYESLFGYFYPSDIGILGGLFLYGVLGIVLLVIIPLVWAVREIKRAKYTTSIFIQAVKYMLIMSILKQVQMGMYLGASVWIVLFFILYASNRLRYDNKLRVGKL
jgi:hypothetical protein